MKSFVGKSALRSEWQVFTVTTRTYKHLSVTVTSFHAEFTYKNSSFKQQRREWDTILGGVTHLPLFESNCATLVTQNEMSCILGEQGFFRHIFNIWLFLLAFNEAAAARGWDQPLVTSYLHQSDQNLWMKSVPCLLLHALMEVSWIFVLRCVACFW